MLLKPFSNRILILPAHGSLGETKRTCAMENGVTVSESSSFLVETVKKRRKMTEEEEPDPVAEKEVEDNETTIAAVSEEMEIQINSILQKIEGFTVRVLELLEAGKKLYNDLSNEFEERMIAIHQEQTEKWQEEIKELRMLDTANEEANARLRDAQYLLQNVHIDS